MEIQVLPPTSVETAAVATSEAGTAPVIPTNLPAEHKVWQPLQDTFNFAKSLIKKRVISEKQREQLKKARDIGVQKRLEKKLEKERQDRIELVRNSRQIIKDLYATDKEFKALVHDIVVSNFEIPKEDELAEAEAPELVEVKEEEATGSIETQPGTPVASDGYGPLIQQNPALKYLSQAAGLIGIVGTLMVRYKAQQLAKEYTPKVIETIGKWKDSAVAMMDLQEVEQKGVPQIPNHFPKTEQQTHAVLRIVGG